MRRWMGIRGMAVALLIGLALGTIGCGGESQEIGKPSQEALAQNVKSICTSLTNDRARMGENLVVAQVNKLGSWGAAAKDAVPTLEKLSKEDPSDAVKAAATEALAKIGGGGAAAQ